MAHRRETQMNLIRPDETKGKRETLQSKTESNTNIEPGTLDTTQGTQVRHRDHQNTGNH